MRKLSVLFMFLITALMFGAYEVGDKVNNFSFTDNEGTSTSVHELTAEGKAVVLFFGSTG